MLVRVAHFLLLPLLCMAPSAAQAHFLWLAAPGSGGQVKAWFSEGPYEGEAELIGKVAHAQVWAIDAAGERAPLRWSPLADGAGELVADLPSGGAAAAYCDYGVVSRGESFLLQYYARHTSSLNASGAGEPLKLDLRATRNGNQPMIAVLFQGKPLGGAEVLVLGPDRERETKSNERGEVLLTDAVAGEWAVRAKHVEPAASGERDGKKFSETRHYATLTLALTENDLKPAAPAAGDSTAAAELLAQARAARSIWNNFEGFNSQIVINLDGVSTSGTVAVDNSGVVSVTAGDDRLREWAEDHLQSIVQHRLPDGPEARQPTIVAEPGQHPLGTSIVLNDVQFKSRYRIKDRAITEVNRQTPGGRFTISVLDVVWNAEHKYLPRAITITSWDKEERITSTLAQWSDYVRIGELDLPGRLLEVKTDGGKQTIGEMVLTDHQLPPAKK